MKPSLPTAFDIAKSKGYTDQQILAGLGGKEAKDEALGVKKNPNLTEKQILAGFGGKEAKDKLVSTETRGLLAASISHLAVIDSIFKARLDAFNIATVQSSLKRKEIDIESNGGTTSRRGASAPTNPAEVGGNTLIAGIVIGAAIPLFQKIAEIFPGVVEGFKATGLVVLEFVKAIGDGLSYVSKALSVLDPIIESDTYKWLKKNTGIGIEEPAVAGELRSDSETKDVEPIREGAPTLVQTVPTAKIQEPSTGGAPSGTKRGGIPESKPHVFASAGNLVNAEHAEKVTKEAVYKDITPEGAALLNVIAGTESPGYDVIFGGSKLSDYNKDYSDHPRIPILIKNGPNAGKFSSAAGRYQFIRKTWDSLATKYNLTDFSPRNQDKAAWYLAQEDYSRRTRRVLQDDLMSGDPTLLNSIAMNLNKTWTSLTGGIEQSKQYKKVTFESKYASALQTVESGALAESSSMASSKYKIPDTIVATAQQAPVSGKSKSGSGSAGITDTTQDYLKRLAAA